MIFVYTSVSLRVTSQCLSRVTKQSNPTQYQPKPNNFLLQIFILFLIRIIVYIFTIHILSIKLIYYS